MALLSRNGEPLQNPYEILGLERGATDDDVNKAFRKLMLKLHPDKQPAGQSEEEAAAIADTFHNVTAAKSFLLDAEHMAAKRAYDSKLASLDRQKHQKINIHSSDKNTQPTFKKDFVKPKRRGSDCTDDRRPNLFKKAGRRASCDDCSTTSQSSSGDDVARNKSNRPSHRREYKQEQDKKQRGSRHTINTMPSRRQGSGSNKTCKKASSFSESCSSFFTDKEAKKIDLKCDKKIHLRKSGMNAKRPSRASVSEKPSSPTHVKPSAAIPTSSSTSLSPEAHIVAKQRITNSIEAIAKKFKCPLTKEIIKEPFTDFEGNSYERDAILKYLETHSTSPVTGAPLYACHLTANAALKDKIRCTLELKKTLDSLGK